MSRSNMPSLNPSALPGGENRALMLAVPLAVIGVLVLAVSDTAALSLLSMAILVSAFVLWPALSPAVLALLLPFYLHPKTFGSLAFSMPELVLLCALAGAALRAAWERKGRGSASLSELSTPLDAPIALFLTAALLSLLASEVLRVSLRDLRTLVMEPVLAFYLATWLLRNRTDITLLLGGLLLGGLAAAALGLFQYAFTDNVITAEGSRRILGPYLSPNHLGLYLGRLIPLVAALGLFSTRLRPIAGLTVAIMGAAVLLTFSLGAWLASFLALLAVVLLWNRRAALAMAGAAVASMMVAIPLLQLERITSHFTLSGGTSFIRLQLWQSSLEMIRDHPVLGVGMDNFLYHYRADYILPGAAAEPNLSHPHNLLLNFWLQMGILGVAAITWLLASLARTWFRLWKTVAHPYDRALLVGMAGATVDLLAHGAVDNSYFLVDLAFHFWLTAGMLIVMTRLPQMK